jgi:hypothetical protein
MMEEQNIRMAIDRHWAASAAGDQVAEHEIYHDDTVCEYPQSGEVIHGRRNLRVLRSHHPGRPSGFAVRRIVGQGNLWVTEYVINYEGKRAYTVSIMEFRDGKVSHETQYFADPFDAPAWRAQWASASPSTPTTPTVKMLAIGTITPGSDPAAVRAILPTEVRETVKLYLDGKIDQWYSLQNRQGVVFILNVTDVSTAHEMLEKLPLGQAHLMSFELLPLGPLNPLRALPGMSAPADQR